ncbi:MAG: Asp-tRNA(Asn)/Glu-tRNA(Gln) amidotransferase subunit GatA [Anaerolineaceae bacterium]|jgi:aspartyl-tRNA(Asn)/glutamyl-tRNA(Gln) amidotransferase subunit A
MTELADLTVRQCSEGLRRGSFSSVELTRALLARIARLEGQIGAFITLTPELALAQAASADQRLAAFRRSPEHTPPALTGIPIAVKDILALEGVRCTCGSRILESFVPPFTATAVRRLLDAGVVILGKTNTDEFAMGSSTENSGYHTTLNPWDPSRVPGGSSGGSAAAVAARMAPAALGTDTGGSVRQPAALCGITGIKPTYGRVSRYGLIAYGSSLDTAGVLARSAEDAALVFQHMAGYDPLDATTLDLPVPQYHLPESSSLSGLRIGVPAEYFVNGMQPEIEEAVRSAIEQFRQMGAEICPISLPHTQYALPVYYLIAPAEASANLARYDGVRYGFSQPAGSVFDLFCGTRGAGFGAEVKARIMLGAYALSAGYYDAYYAQAQKVRTLIKRDFEQTFASVDAIVAPVTPSTAFHLGEHRDDPVAMYLEDIFTLPANLAGVPGIAFPVGIDRQGLPIAMQIMAPHFGEDLLFRMAHAYQQITDWHLQKPSFQNITS